MVSIASLMYSAALLAAGPASSSLNVQGCDLGEHYVFAKTDCQIQVENLGATPVRLSGIAADLPADSSERTNAEVPAHGRVYLPVHVTLESTAGLQRHLIRMHTDEPGNPEIRIPVRVFGMSVLDEQPKIEFGVVDLGAPAAQRSVTLTSLEASDLAIESVLAKPAWVDVKVSGAKLDVSVRADAPLGLRDEFIKLRLNAPHQREAWILVSADIRGDVVPSINPLAMGMIRNSDDNEFRIVLTSRSGKAFDVGAVELEDVRGTVKASNCIPAKAGCRWITFKMAKTQPMGSIKGNLFVSLPNTRQKLKISLRGLLVDKDFQAKPLELKSLEDVSGRTSNAPKPLDLASAIKNTVEGGPEQEPAGTGPLLKWSVANGQLIHGFQIFRSNAEQGPFGLITANTIPSKASDATTESYWYRDNSAEAGKTYWYYIAIIYIDGHRQQLTTPLRVVAK